MFASSNQVLTEVGTKLIQVAPKFNQSWIQLEMKPFTYSNEITQKMRMWKTPVEKSVENVENSWFSTDISILWDGEKNA